MSKSRLILKNSFLLFLLSFLFVHISFAQSISTSGLSQDGPPVDEGQMFDVLANQNIILNKIEAILMDDNSPYDINIYYKVGSYIGSETTSGDWTLLANTGAITSDVGGNITDLPLGGATLSMSAGTTYGFYFSNAGGNDFERHGGVTTGNIATTNAFATIFAGVDVNNPPFSGTSTSDVSFIGTFSFALPTPVVATAPIPTMSQWGLLIFGLLIINLSVFFVHRRELI